MRACLLSGKLEMSIDSNSRSATGARPYCCQISVADCNGTSAESEGATSASSLEAATFGPSPARIVSDDWWKPLAILANCFLGFAVAVAIVGLLRHIGVVHPAGFWDVHTNAVEAQSYSMSGMLKDTRSICSFALGLVTCLLFSQKEDVAEVDGDGEEVGVTESFDAWTWRFTSLVAVSM
eukprot:TRINITY_DN20641_c0_g2_i1.p1 TRINITY_DN20641_c0_g2~~TRINITY_DN20641_c0_g2_i1.p1  ORF type:complete len:180 (-),score=37.75 TRINITY_DN20641_c0_g2_i1:175-714(-)